jgi:putative aldouronate transport system substrate-binding protein
MFIEKNRIKKILGIVCLMSMLTGVLSGCSSSAGSSSGNSSSGKSGALITSNSEHSTVSVMTASYNDTSGIESGDVFKKLEEITNCTLKITWVPGASYTDKFNVLMASGNLPNIVMIPDVKSSVFLDAVDADQFWDLDSYMTKMGNYKNISEISLKNSSIEGKHYVLPRERLVKRIMVCYRSDWAKKAGIDAPDTLDNLYNMAKTFTNGDYDGNGKKDTIGLALGTYSDGGGSVIDCLNALVVANGGYNYWGIKDSKVTPMYDTTEYIDTMTWLNKMYSEGMISSDFSIEKTSAVTSDLFDKEKTGMMLTYVIPSTSDPLVKAKMKADSSLKRSDIVNYCFLKDSKGDDAIPCEAGYAGGFAVSKSSVTDETRLNQILGYFNVVLSKEGQDLLNIGIEGREYKVDSDGESCTVIDSDLQKTEVGDLNQLFVASGLVYNSFTDDLAKKQHEDQTTYKDSDLISNVTIPLSSDEYSNNSTTLNNIIDTAQIKYIMGQETLDQFNADIKKWHTSGGDTMIKEYTDSYTNSK